jgi:hypothetical protein
LVITTKTAAEATAQMTAWLAENTSLNYFGEGSIVKALLDAINSNVEQYYNSLDFNMTNQFVSSATGMFLDLIGELLNCKRNFQETDSNYRYRITNKVYTAQTANEISIRLKCLSVPNVKTVILKPYLNGAGSFVVYVDIIDKSFLSDTIIAVNEALEEVKAYGVNGYAVSAKQLYVNLKIRLTYTQNVSQQQKRFICINALAAANKYIDNLAIGETISLQKMYFEMFKTSDIINSINVDKFTVSSNGIEKQYAVQTLNCAWDSQFTTGTIEVI